MLRNTSVTSENMPPNHVHSHNHRPCCVAVLLAALGGLTGCTNYGLVGRIENGGDSPPFASLEKILAGDLAQIGSGDAVAAVEGNVTKVYLSSRVQIDLLVPVGQIPPEQRARLPEEKPSKEQRRRAERKPSKEERREEQRRRAEQQPSKEQRERAKPSKEQRKQREKEEARKRLAPALVLLKHVSGAGKPKFVSHLELRSDKDSARVRFRLSLMNFGKQDFAGKVRLFERLPASLKFGETVRLCRVRRNTTKDVLRWTPYLSLLAKDMDEYAFTPLSPDAVKLTESFSKGMLRYQIESATIKRGAGIAIEFDAVVPKWD